VNARQREAEAYRAKLIRSSEVERKNTAREMVRKAEAAQRQARAERVRAMKEGTAKCRQARDAARSMARDVCSAELDRYREAREAFARAREATAREREIVAELRAQEATDRRYKKTRAQILAPKRKREKRVEGQPPPKRRRSTSRRSIEALQESDAQVLSNIDPSLHAYWRKVRGIIKGSRNRSRTEAFLEHVYEHPAEIYEQEEDPYVAAERAMEERAMLEWERAGGREPVRPDNPPSFVRNRREEAIWNRAKAAVRPRWQRYDRPWAVVVATFRKMRDAAKKKKPKRCCGK